MEVNGETITGVALIFLSVLLLYAGVINEVWSLLVPADFLILAMWDHHFTEKKEAPDSLELGITRLF